MKYYIREHEKLNQFWQCWFEKVGTVGLDQPPYLHMGFDGHNTLSSYHLFRNCRTCLSATNKKSLAGSCLESKIRRHSLGFCRFLVLWVQSRVSAWNSLNLFNLTNWNVLNLLQIERAINMQLIIMIAISLVPQKRNTQYITCCYTRSCYTLQYCLLWFTLFKLLSYTVKTNQHFLTLFVFKVLYSVSGKKPFISLKGFLM